MEIDLDEELMQLRFDFRLLAEEGTLPKWQVADILLDSEDDAIAHYVLWKLQHVFSSPRVFITWGEVDSALSELETP